MPLAVRARGCAGMARPRRNAASTRASMSRTSSLSEPAVSHVELRRLPERVAAAHGPVRDPLDQLPRIHARSEEHTSELQSPDHLVCRLLLEKKKKKILNLLLLQKTKKIN